MRVAMLPLHLESTLAKEGHTRKFKLRLWRFNTRWHRVECGRGRTGRHVNLGLNRPP